MPYKCVHSKVHFTIEKTSVEIASFPDMSRIANNALLGGGVRVRVWIREQRKIKRRSKVLLSLCWQSWTSLSALAAREDNVPFTAQQNTQVPE